jgi:AraC-like DNA-binding protein
MQGLIQPFSLQPVNIVQILLLFISIFGSTLLWSHRKYRGLIVLLLVNSILMGFNLSEELGGAKSIHLVTPALSFAIGPAIYFFTTQLVFQSHNFKYFDGIHFLPVFLAIPFTDNVQAVLAIGTFSQLIYLGLSFPLIQRFHRATRALRSDAEDLRLDWLIYGLAILGALVILDVIRLNLQTHLNYTMANTWYVVHLFLIFIIFTWIIFKALQPTSEFRDLVFYETELLDSKTIKQPNKDTLSVQIADESTRASDEQYDNSKTTNQLVGVNSGDPKSKIAQIKMSNGDKSNEHSHLYPLFDSMNDKIDNEQLFLEPRLSLRCLSDLMGVNEKDISTTINVITDKNFNDYINSKRIQFAVRQLKSNYRGNIIDLALSSGYNAKSTFNSAFKKHIGMTPTDYRQICK